MSLPPWLLALSVARPTLAWTLMGVGLVQLLVATLLLFIHVDWADPLPLHRHRMAILGCILRFLLLFAGASWLLAGMADLTTPHMSVGALLLGSGSLLVGIRHLLWIGLLDVMPTPPPSHGRLIGLALILTGLWLG